MRAPSRGRHRRKGAGERLWEPYDGGRAAVVAIRNVRVGPDVRRRGRLRAAAGERVRVGFAGW